MLYLDSIDMDHGNNTVSVKNDSERISVTTRRLLTTR